MTEKEIYKEKVFKIIESERKNNEKLLKERPSSIKNVIAYNEQLDMLELRINEIDSK